MTLVQVGTGGWIDPADVLRMYTVNNSAYSRMTQQEHGNPDPGPTTTYLTCRSFDPHCPAHTVSTDWSSDRVEAALGLIPADRLNEMMRPR